MDNPRYFLEKVVSPNLAELTADYASEQKAFNAAASVDSLVAALFHWCEEKRLKRVAGIKDDSHFREQLARENPDYALLRDVAKAFKHVELRRGTPLVSSSGQVEARGLGWGEGAWGEARFGGSVQVVVTTDAGDVRVLDSVINNALAFIENEMKAAGC